MHKESNPVNIYAAQSHQHKNVYKIEYLTVNWHQNYKLLEFIQF